MGEGEEHSRRGGEKGGRQRLCKGTEEWEGQNAERNSERRGGGEGQRERS